MKFVAKTVFVLVLGFFFLGAAGKTKTVMFVGDSITAGTGATVKEARFATEAVRLLNEKRDGFTYVEKNIGVSGSCLCPAVGPRPQDAVYPNKLKEVIAARPEIVVFQIGTNDQTAHSSISDFALSYRMLIREAKAALPGSAIFCITVPPNDRKGEKAAFHDISNTIIQEVAAQEGVSIIPIHTLMDDKLQNDFDADGLHPNNYGHRNIAIIVADAIRAKRVQSSDKFDFSMRRAGKYRIMGYEIFIPENSAKDGVTCFEGISKDGFEYSSFGEVLVTSPYHAYNKPVDFTYNGVARQKEEENTDPNNPDARNTRRNNYSTSSWNNNNDDQAPGIDKVTYRYDKERNMYSIKLPSTNGKKIKVTFVPMAPQAPQAPQAR